MPRGYVDKHRPVLLLTGLATLVASLMPLTNAAAGIRRLLRSALRAVSFGVPAISHTTPMELMGVIGRAGRRRMTSVRGPPAARHSGMSYIASGCIWCGRGRDGDSRGCGRGAGAAAGGEHAAAEDAGAERAASSAAGSGAGRLLRCAAGTG